MLSAYIARVAQTDTPSTKEVTHGVDPSTPHADANETTPSRGNEVPNAYAVNTTGESTHLTLRVAVGHAQNPEDALQRLAAAARAQGKPIRVRVRIDIYDPAKRQYLSWAGAHWGVETDQEAAVQGLREALDAVFAKLAENPDPGAIVRRMRLPMEEIILLLGEIGMDSRSGWQQATDDLYQRINAL